MPIIFFLFLILPFACKFSLRDEKRGITTMRSAGGNLILQKMFGCPPVQLLKKWPTRRGNGSHAFTQDMRSAEGRKIVFGGSFSPELTGSGRHPLSAQQPPLFLPSFLPLWNVVTYNSHYFSSSFLLLAMSCSTTVYFSRQTWPPNFLHSITQARTILYILGRVHERDDPSSENRTSIKKQSLYCLL